MEIRETEFDDLLDEILMLIFYKVALESVVRCKLVCKRWRSLISDPFFTSTYNPSSIPYHPLSYIRISVATSSPSKITVGRLCEVNDDAVEHTIPSRCHLVEALGSCNGLVGLHDDRGDFCLLNPWTKAEKWVRVGPQLGRAFSIYGLCHVPARDEYKLVLSSFFSHTFYVVSFKGQGSCKSKRHSNRPPRGYPGAVVKGVPYWIACRSQHGIIYFDPVREEFGEVRGPVQGGGSRLVAIGALGGQLTVAVRGKGRHPGLWDVWALEEEGSWSKVFTLARRSPCPILLTSWVRENRVLSAELCGYTLWIHSVGERNMRSMNWSRVGRLMLDRTLGVCKVVVFIPSLVNPNHCGR